ncbi:MAG: TIGR00153 family protein [Legionellales bacterium]|nr:TIGR00153 family protein [Legionellales bacterium]|tara:strand:- start:1093 stop:1770 length:678 start_codon:yes stop_codon:yes gene_type:complete
MLLSSFLKLVESTPFKVIQEHSKIVSRAPAHLSDLFHAIAEENWQVAKECHDAILVVEHEADVLKRDIRHNLSKNLMLPVDRTDILELIVMQDRIANITKDISSMLIERQINLPEVTQLDWFAICEQTIMTCGYARDMVQQLNIIVETGFVLDSLSGIRSLQEKLDESEHASDVLQSKIRAGLFAHEKHMLPIDAVFLYQINYQLGLISDVCQHVGARFVLMVSV